MGLFKDLSEKLKQANKERAERLELLREGKAIYYSKKKLPSDAHKLVVDGYNRALEEEEKEKKRALEKQNELKKLKLDAQIEKEKAKIRKIKQEGKPKGKKDDSILGDWDF